MSVFELEIIEQIIKQIEDSTDIKISSESPLIGGDSPIDSMKLVEVCLFLEDESNNLGFAFDWTSANAMSNSRSMFKNVKSLAQEFVRQKGELS